jgi:hypothetical protein
MTPAGFFASGRAVDLILAVMAVEIGVLLWRRRPARTRGALIDLILAFAPGVCLLLALRAALTGAGWLWIALALAASFPFHLADLARRRR